MADQPLWDDDNAQFARLLAEINAVGLDEDQTEAIAKSMGLDVPEVKALFRRAEVRWEALKRAHLPHYTPDPSFDVAAEGEEYIQVEYDLTYFGGDYSKQGDYAYVSVALANKWGIEEAFRQTTGHDPQHIVHYSDETYTKDGELKDDDGED